MASSLTSARPRRTAQQQQQQHEGATSSPGLGADVDDDGGGDGKDKEKLLHIQHYPPTHAASSGGPGSPLPSSSSAAAAPSQRPFGSTVPSHSYQTSTSGWITSGNYARSGSGHGKGHSSSSSLSAKGKGKLARHAVGPAGEALGPLRDYGGGMGVVGYGEFKLLLVITLLAAVVRLWRLDRPDSVVFDEVHFGGFASKYIKSKFFMDVHPPLAKLLITFAAWFAGFRGDFDFKDIGKEYGPDHVPYIAMRLLPASLGVALVPIAYLTLRSLGCRPATSLLASLLLTFENGLITQSRLILLDSPLLFFTGLTVFFWTGFSAEDGRRAGSSYMGPFSPCWWSWLALTGVALGATFSCKWVGLFTIATIGLATLEQLWSILGDTRVSMKTIGRHFVARALCLIIIPATVYLFWFWVHFMILSDSGDGDGFMSSEYQHTLRGHGMPDTYADVVLGSRVTIKHYHTQGGYLHSHPHNYPTGSKQQQITLYPHRDDNNDWILLNETQQFGKDTDPSRSTDLQFLMDKAFIRLHHPSSGKKLHSHDIRPPVSEVDFQNEVSGYGFPDFDGDANDNFQVEIDQDETDSRDRYAKKRVRALRTKFKLRHVLTGCYLFSHKVKLPDWGFEQQEVTCNKNPTHDNAIWYIETNTHDFMPAKAEKLNYRKPGFFNKFAELQGVMWRTNAGLTDRHAYDSRPHHWPYLRRGINFWVKDHRQIYLIGNPVTWWLSSLSVILYAAARGFLIIRSKRGYRDLHNTTFQFYDRLCGFLFIGWGLHYFPFFIMNRQLFLHHYFPSLYFSILLFAAVFDLATSTLKPQFRVQIGAIVLICALWAYVHWSPLTYAGKWTKQDCEDAKWLKNWDFSCADFHASYGDYDNVPHPTPSKPVVHGGAGAMLPHHEQQQQAGQGGDGDAAQAAAGVETTESVIAEVIEPGKDAFAADKDDPAPAPMSEGGNAAELFAQASVAHEQAEERNNQQQQQHVAVDADKDGDAVEPTNLPGPELPAQAVAEQLKEQQEEERQKVAQVPLEEAAPTPSSSSSSSLEHQEVDVEVEAGAQKVRLAEIDDQAVRDGGAVDKAGSNDANKVQRLKKVIDDDDDNRAETAPRDPIVRVGDEMEDKPKKQEEKKGKLDELIDEIAAKAKPEEDEDILVVQKQQRIVNVDDPDEAAAAEEREQHRLAQQQQ